MGADQAPAGVSTTAVVQCLARQSARLGAHGLSAEAWAHMQHYAMAPDMQVLHSSTCQRVLHSAKTAVTHSAALRDRSAVLQSLKGWRPAASCGDMGRPRWTWRPCSHGGSWMMTAQPCSSCCRCASDAAAAAHCPLCRCPCRPITRRMVVASAWVHSACPAHWQEHPAM